MKSLLTKELVPLIAGLSFQSETDTPIELYAGELTKVIDANEFFAKLSKRDDWFGDEETATAQQWEQIRAVMEKRLSNLTVLKIGVTDIRYYVVGIDSESRCAGITFRAVET